MSKGSSGILLTASGDAVVPALKAAEDAGLLVIALDTQLDPPDAAQATFATDNYDGRQAHRPVGGRAPRC